MLRWYKSALSPMMASTCRFLPTCSQYSMDSYRQDRRTLSAVLFTCFYLLLPALLCSVS
jgi:putative component of membrane protein insertase Oxa1/YidC/SpoIIIJ protein YidD